MADSLKQRLRSKWATIAGFLGLLASVIAIGTFVLEVTDTGPDVPAYRGEFDADFAEFVWSHTDEIIKLDVVFDEHHSESITRWQGSAGEREPVIFLPVSHGDAGTEFGFFYDDPDLSFNTRFWDAVSVSGYFKVHSSQGPYQGWMSVTLRAVGREHVRPPG